MYTDELQVGSLVIDIVGNRLDARFLRETGAIDDHFTILKGVAPEALRICSFSMDDGVITVRWKSVAGQNYRIQHTPSIDSPIWTDASDVITATGATSTWTTPVPDGETQRFYRVVQLAPAAPMAPMLAATSTTMVKGSALRMTKRAAKGTGRRK
jgi:hypothetical protein